MSRVKDIRLKVIPAKIANRFVKKWHYSGKVVQNSSLHFGAFLDGALHGVMSYGSPLDKRKVLPLVHKNGKPCKWNDMLELNRMAFDEYLPQNAESRCISVSFKLINNNAPHVKWILSYADGCDCGDGAIYRAVGFYLTLIKENSDLFLLPNGNKIHSMTIKSSKNLISKHGSWKNYLNECHPGWKKLKGYQLRYIYLIDKECELNCPDIAYSKIDEAGAGMYKGEKVSYEKRNNMPQ